MRVNTIMGNTQYAYAVRRNRQYRIPIAYLSMLIKAELECEAEDRLVTWIVY